MRTYPALASVSVSKVMQVQESARGAYAVSGDDSARKLANRPVATRVNVWKLVRS